MLGEPGQCAEGSGAAALTAAGKSNPSFAQPASARDEDTAVRIGGNIGDHNSTLGLRHHGVEIFGEGTRFGDSLEPCTIGHAVM